MKDYSLQTCPKCNGEVISLYNPGDTDSVRAWICADCRVDQLSEQIADLQKKLKEANAALAYYKRLVTSDLQTQVQDRATKVLHDKCTAANKELKNSE